MIFFETRPKYPKNLKMKKRRNKHPENTYTFLACPRSKQLQKTNVKIQTRNFNKTLTKKVLQLQKPVVPLQCKKKKK